MKRSSVFLLVLAALTLFGCNPDHSGDTAPPVPNPDAGKPNPNSVEGNPYIPAEAKKQMQQQGGQPAPAPGAPAAGGK